MERNCSNRGGVGARCPADALLAAVMLALVAVCGCEKKTGADAKAEAAAATNAVEAAAAPAAPLTPEEREAAEMRDLLDDGQTQAAIRHARNLMDSESKQIRSQVLETLAWIGHRALPEITEMVNDANPDIAEEALSAWEQAFSEISGEHRQAAIIAETVPKLKNPDAVNAVLQHAADIGEHVALPMLSRIIDSNAADFRGESAREMYTHVSGGEIYESRAATQKFLEESKTNSR